MVRLTESEKAHFAELGWTIFGAIVLLAVVWNLLQIGGAYAIP